MALALCCVDMQLFTVIQVSQLAGYVSEHSAYHHGDVSLTSTIVGMAQNFVGSNNINLLYPSGLHLNCQRPNPSSLHFYCLLPAA